MLIARAYCSIFRAFSFSFAAALAFLKRAFYYNDFLVGAQILFRIALLPQLYYHVPKIWI